MPATNTNSSEAARMNFRLPPEIKERIESAARISGITVTDFAISALSQSAEKVLNEQRNRVLSDRDRDLFLTLLEKPPVPNAALKQAAKRYLQRVKQ